MKEDKLYIDWVTALKDIKELAKQIQESDKFSKINKILVISKGGFIPGYFLGKYLGIKYFEVLPVISYNEDHTKAGKPRVLPELRGVDNRTGWLIVDDLVDSGDTMELAKELYPKAFFCSMYKKQNAPSPDYFTKEYTRWIVFPWEANDIRLTFPL